MAMLKSISAHITCSYLIQKYLEEGIAPTRAAAHDLEMAQDYPELTELTGRHTRALARDFVNLHTEHERDDWAEVMDITRAGAENDTPWGGKQAVMYQHFIISPDPRDNVGLEALRALTMEWVHEFFGNDIEAGSLGNYEVAIVYHDDNSRGIPHAHVVVNNTDIGSGRRLHISNDQNDHLANRLQEISKSRGLSYFDNSIEKHERITRGAFITRSERELMARGHYCWKQDLREMIDVARRLSSDTEGFLRQVRGGGIVVEEKGGDYLFTHPKNKRWHTSGYRLGRNYTKLDIAYAQKSDRLDGKVRNEIVAKNVNKYISKMEVAAKVEAGVTLRQVAQTLKINDRYKISTSADYDTKLKEFALKIQRAKESGSSLIDSYKNAYAEISQAKQTASKGDFFAGATTVANSRKPQSSVSNKAATSKALKNAKKRRSSNNPSPSTPRRGGEQNKGRGKTTK